MENNPQTPFFETFFSKNKKLFLFVPLIIVGLLLTLYFTNDANASNDKTNEKNVDVDLTLPNAKQQELSDNKIDAMDEFNQLSDAKTEEDKKTNEVQIDDIDANSSSTKQGTTYQQPNEEVVSKIDKMIMSMDKDKPKKKSYNSENYNQSSYNQSTSSDNYSQKKEDNTKENFDEFFNSNNSKKENNSTQSTQNTQNETFAYAVIKGDQIGLRNNARVTFILPKDAMINGYFFKKNTVFYAQASFSNNNRILFNITNISQKVVNVKVYDAEDGSLGLQVKQSVIAEGGKDVVSDATDEVNVSGIPLGGTLKRIFKRKQQEIKVDLLNNQKIILR